MEPMLAEFAGGCGELSFAEPSVPVVSTVTGRPVEPGQWSDPEYWVEQVRQAGPVRRCAGRAGGCQQVRGVGSGRGAGRAGAAAGCRRGSAAAPGPGRGHHRVDRAGDPARQRRAGGLERTAPGPSGGDAADVRLPAAAVLDHRDPRCRRPERGRARRRRPSPARRGRTAGRRGRGGAHRPALAAHPALARRPRGRRRGAAARDRASGARGPGRPPGRVRHASRS